MALVAQKERKHLSADALFRTVRSGFAAIPDCRLSDTNFFNGCAQVGICPVFSQIAIAAGFRQTPGRRELGDHLRD